MYQIKSACRAPTLLQWLPVSPASLTGSGSRTCLASGMHRKADASVCLKALTWCLAAGVQEVAKRTERLAGGPVTGTKGFTDAMSRTPDADYPVLGSQVDTRLESQREGGSTYTRRCAEAAEASCRS